MKCTSIGKLKTTCVFCGTNLGKNRGYIMACNTLGIEMVKRNIDLRYGWGYLGLSSCVSYIVCMELGSVLVPDAFTMKKPDWENIWDWVKGCVHAWTVIENIRVCRWIHCVTRRFMILWKNFFKLYLGLM